MIDALIQQLRDRDPAVRRQAIIALGKSKDIAALRPLADVFRTDSEPELRELARKAGIYIRQQHPNTAPLPTQPPPSAAPTPGQTRASTPSDSSIRRRSLAELAAQVRGDEEASDIKASRRIEEYQQRRAEREQNRFSPVTPLDADEGDPPPPRLFRGGASGFGDDSDSDMNFLSAYLDRTGDDDLSSYLDDAPAADDEPEPPKRGGRGSSIRRALNPNAGDVVAAGGLIENDADIPRAISIADYGFVRGKEYRVDPEDKSRARKNMDAALTLEERGQKDKALKTLALALKLDPNLINDGFFNSIASTLTGKDGDEAIAILISGERRSEAIQTSKQEQKTKRVEKHMEKVSEGTSTGLLFELVVFFLINGVGWALAFVISVQGLVNFAADLITSLATSPQFSQATDSLERLQQIAQAFNAIMLVAIIVTALLVGFFAVFLQFIQSLVIHVIASLLGGKGRFVYQLTTVTAAYNKYMPFFFVLLCIVNALVFVTPYALLCGSLVLPLFGLYISFKGSQRIGEAYAFGAGMGCLAYALSTVIIYALYFIIGIALGGTVDQLLQSLIEANVRPI